MMNILIIGSGGREHALAWSIKKSQIQSNLYIAPGNAGTAEFGKNISINTSNFQEVKELVKDKNIELVVVGPEAPLVEGITDFFKSDDDLKQVFIIGPSQKAAKLEGSKDFAKEFMYKYHIPTAKYQTFTKETLHEAYEFLSSLTPPYVLKADGLAAGKGVLILDDIEEAKASLKEMFEGKFGDAGSKVVIEEFLKGIELSVFAYTNGKEYILLPNAKDYKRIGEKDTGLNTGGMGAVSPVPFADAEFMEKVEERIIKPTISGIEKEKLDYRGFVFFGLINIDGDPYVIEYNVRMGDPETEVVMPRLQNSILDVFMADKAGKLNELQVKFEKQTVTTVMLVSQGYPGAYETGKEIIQTDSVEDSILFHAGTKLENGTILTNGGRVIAVSSFGNDMEEALGKSYKNAGIVCFKGKYYRKDIGFDLRK